MKYISIKKADTKKIAKDLLVGRTIIYPTETCYGLGCDGTNQGAVDNIFEIKKRQKEKPLLVVMASVAMAREYVLWNPLLQKLSAMFWPGPLTVVADIAYENRLANGVKSVDNTLAFRITDHPFARALSTDLGAPVVATSANISSMGSPYDITHVTDMFVNEKIQPDIVIDAGDLPHKLDSTIVSVQKNSLRILRQGELIIREKDLL